MCKFRDLAASEIECRIGMVRENGLTLLLYKDARVDMNLLDETVGSANWQREHYEVKGNLYCRVGIKLDGEWVWKSDCGTESNAEAVKGESSDSFKRACVNWGIGRELYSAPFIWIGKDKCNIINHKCNDKFVVEKIIILNKQIKSIEIWNKTKNLCAFVWQNTPSAQQKPPNVPNSASNTIGGTNTPPMPQNAPQGANTAAVAADVPFPEVENRASGIVTFQKACETVMPSGQYAGEKLTDVYKKDLKYLRTLCKMPGTEQRFIDAVAALDHAVIHNRAARAAHPA